MCSRSVRSRGPPSPCRWLDRASPGPPRSGWPRARCPHTFTLPFVRPSELASRGHGEHPLPGRRGPGLPEVRDRPALHGRRDHARVQDPGLRLQRRGPRTDPADDPGQPGRRAADEHAAAAAGGAVPERADAVEVHLRPLAALDLDPPARVGLAPAVRRVRLGPDVPGPGEEVLLPERPGRPDPLVPRPRRAPHVPERVQRSRGALHPPRRGGGESRHPDRRTGIAVRAVRRADDRAGRDVRHGRLA